MVTDSEIITRLREFLQNSDLNTTTTAIVRRKLEEDFGVDLTEKKVFIREQVDIYLQSQTETENENEEEDGDDKGSNSGNEEESESEEEEEEEEEEEKKVGVKNDRNRGKGRSNKPETVVKKKASGGGFTKLSSLSPQLQQFLGVPEMSRTEVVKQMWVYIREKKLQDPDNRRNILCDEKLRALFKVDSINMFQMNKVLSKHIWPLASEEGPTKPTQKDKQRKQEREESDEAASKEKRQKTGSKGSSSGFLAPLPLSDALMNFFGTGETTLSRSEVVKKIWEYIKENNLQDPADKRRIICDDKLKVLFEIDSFNGFTVPKLLSSHFIKPK